MMSSHGEISELLQSYILTQENIGKITESSTLFKTSALFLSLARIVGVIFGVGLPSIYIIIDSIMTFIT